MGDCQYINYDEAYAEKHSPKQDTKPGRGPDELDYPEIISSLDVIDEVDHGKDPPRVAKERFERACILEELALVTEIQELQKLASLRHLEFGDSRIHLP